MKKIIILLIVLAAFKVDAQTAFSQTASNATGAITNTSVDTVNYTLTKSYKQVSIQPTVTKATGTMAGTAILYYSVGGTNYVASGDTLTLTNVTTNTALWNKTSSARYWRIITGGATTVTGTVTAKISATP